MLKTIQNKIQKSYKSVFSKNNFLFLYVIAIILLIFGSNYSKIYLVSILILAVIFLYDTYKFFNHIQGKFWERVIYLLLSILAYFSYIQAEAFAKLSIYGETGIKAEYFDTALAYFKGIYFIFGVLLTTSYLLAGVALIFLFLSFIPMMIDYFEVDKKVVKSIQKQYIHAFLYLISATILVFAFFKDNTKLYESLLGKNYVQSGIIKYSFLPNQSCKNIPKDTLIKLLDSNKVLVTNVKQLPLFSIPDDTNVTFKIQPCKTIE